MRSSRVLAPALLGLFLLPAAAGACTSSGNTGGAPDTARPTDLGDVVDLRGRTAVEVQVPDNSYTPKAVLVSPGTTVTFTNTGANLHNVTPNDASWFPAVELKPAASGVVVAPQTPATYRYYCTLHGSPSGGQRGAIVVDRP